MAENALNDVKTGVVEFNDDPTRKGRLKVRIAGVNDNIPVKNLPWVTMAGSGTASGNGGGSISIPEIGAHVRVTFKDNDPNSIEWSAMNKVDDELSNEIASDYVGTTVLMHDSRQAASLKFQPNSGMTMYYAGSHVQLCPDNTINIHYGEGNSGTMIQLADGKISIQGNAEVNISTPGTVTVEGDSIKLDGKSAVQIKGDTPGECAINGKTLVDVLLGLAEIIDNKMPASFGLTQQAINGLKEALLNQQIQYI